MISAVIIDDMPAAIANLKADLEAYCPAVRVVGTAEGVVSGAKLLRQQAPDILFLDIQLQDGTGFDLLEILPAKNYRVIFTTASDAFAIKAFRYSAVDYLLKPVDPDDLVAAVAKIKAQLHRGLPESAAGMDLLLDTVKKRELPRRLALHTQEKILVAEIADIVRCESTGNYTHFYFTDGSKLLVTKTLKEYDKLLHEHRFVRVHQSHLINTALIQAYVKTEGGYLRMRDGSEVPVSVRKKPEVIRLLERL